MKLYSISTNYHQECKWIADKFGMKFTPKIEDADLCYLGGGEDISPIYYQKSGKQAHRSVYSNLRRDQQEIAEAKIAIEKGIPIFGTCRGSQLICVLAGGELVQHQSNPGFEHEIITEDGIIIATSTHHQAQYPFNLLPQTSYEILGYTEGLVGDRYLDYDTLAPPKTKEVEICYYKNIKALASQPHFEFYFQSKQDYQVASLNFIYSQIEKYLLKS